MTAPTIRTLGDAPNLNALLPAMPQARQWQEAWSSAEQLATHLEHGPIGWEPRIRTDRDPEFSGTKTFAEALAICRDGWTAGAETARRIRDRINATAPRTPRLTRYDVAGAVPNVARAIAGNPMHMRRLDPTRARRNPIVTLVSDLSASSAIAASTMVNRAGVIAAVVDAIENAGFACHVVGYGGGKKDAIVARVMVTLKEPHDRADLERLAFGLGHPAMYRRMIFAAITQDRFTDAIGGSLGRPLDLEHTPSMTAAGVYLAPGCNRNSGPFLTEDAAATAGLAFILDALAAQGCPAFLDRPAAA